MVGGKLQFDSILVGGEFWNRHDARVVDCDIKLGDSFINFCCSGADGVEIIQLDRDESGLDGGVESLDF